MANPYHFAQDVLLSRLSMGQDVRGGGRTGEFEAEVRMM